MSNQTRDFAFERKIAWNEIRSRVEFNDKFGIMNAFLLLTGIEQDESKERLSKPSTAPESQPGSPDVYGHNHDVVITGMAYEHKTHSKIKEVLDEMHLGGVIGEEDMRSLSRALERWKASNKKK